MDKIYLNNLYDYYSTLLTEKQRKYYEDYNFYDYSLSEISENYHVSRSAIQKNLKETENNLITYEKKLKLYEKNKKIRKLIKDLDNDLKEKIEELI